MAPKTQAQNKTKKNNFVGGIPFSATKCGMEKMSHEKYPTKKSDKKSAKSAPGCSPTTTADGRRQARGYSLTRDVFAIGMSLSVVHVGRLRRCVEFVDKTELCLRVKQSHARVVVRKARSPAFLYRMRTCRQIPSLPLIASSTILTRQMFRLPPLL